MSSQRLCDSSHSQKLRRRTSDSFAGIPTASRTCSRRYSSDGVIGSDGFVFTHFASFFQLSHRAQPSTGATTCRAGVELADVDEVAVVWRDAVEDLEPVLMLLPADARAVVPRVGDGDDEGRPPPLSLRAELR